MSITFKKWTGLGLGAALLTTTALGACGGEGGESGEHAESGEGALHAEAGESGEGESGEGESGEAGHSAAMDALPIEKRLAFMSGHVQAGLALYRAGAAEEAAPHLLHPVSETHAAERAGLDALGFDAALFERVSAALGSGVAADAAEADLLAAEENLDQMRRAAGGNPYDIVAYLMDTVAEEYQVGVRNGAITDPGEYQDAYGFAVVARNTIANLEDDALIDLQDEVDRLIALWPESGPLASSEPAPVKDVLAQVSRVRLELSEFL